jgi:hypothetical protein
VSKIYFITHKFRTHVKVCWLHCCLNLSRSPGIAVIVCYGDRFVHGVQCKYQPSIFLAVVNVYFASNVVRPVNPSLSLILYFTTFRKQRFRFHWKGTKGSSSGEPFVGNIFCYCFNVLDYVYIVIKSYNQTLHFLCNVRFFIPSLLAYFVTIFILLNRDYFCHALM